MEKLYLPHMVITVLQIVYHIFAVIQSETIKDEGVSSADALCLCLVIQDLPDQFYLLLCQIGLPI